MLQKHREEDGSGQVNDQHQIVIAAEAFGQGAENNLLAPIVGQVRTRLGDDYGRDALVTADAGFHQQIRSRCLNRKTLTH